MFTPVLRMILIVGCIAWAIFSYSEQKYLMTILSSTAAALFAYGYFRYGTVYAAFQQLRKEDYDKAEKIIAKTKHPDILSKGQKGFYHFIKGNIAYEKRDWDKSYVDFIKALEIGVRTPNNISITLFKLAEIEFKRENYTSSQEFLSKGYDFELKPIVRKEMDELTKKLKDQNRRRIKRS